jgi:hypothetical protein
MAGAAPQRAGRAKPGVRGRARAAGARYGGGVGVGWGVELLRGAGTRNSNLISLFYLRAERLC